VDSFGDSAVIIKARFKTKPIKQWLVGREMNRRIKKKFDEVGIEAQFPIEASTSAKPASRSRCRWSLRTARNFDTSCARCSRRSKRTTAE